MSNNSFTWNVLVETMLTRMRFVLMCWNGIGIAWQQNIKLITKRKLEKEIKNQAFFQMHRSSVNKLSRHHHQPTHAAITVMWSKPAWHMRVISFSNDWNGQLSTYIKSQFQGHSTNASQKNVWYLWMSITY